jgi:hypothetical protein
MVTIWMFAGGRRHAPGFRQRQVQTILALSPGITS